MNILVLNSGSSSQKSALFRFAGTQPAPPGQSLLWEAKIEWDTAHPRLAVRWAGGGRLDEPAQAWDRGSALRRMLASLWSGAHPVLQSAAEIGVAGHRVVHGGLHSDEPRLITAELKRDIAALAKFAPLHNPAAVEGIELVEQLAPAAPQVAVFDTGFHRTLPPAAAFYPGPKQWPEQGIRRYGFHGINHQYCAARAAGILGKDSSSLRLVTCHLGNGCSLAAVQGGQSVDTTMGFTPLEGLMMGTRSGSIDPGILTYLLREARVSGDDLDDLLNRRSGLLGVSGVSSDMRQVLAAAARGDDGARLAVDMFVHRLRAGIAAMAASMGGIDALVFTAGIGENSPEVRAAACAKLEFLGVRLDPDLNRESPPERDISAPHSPVRVLVIPAQEDWAIAAKCFHLLAQGAAGPPAPPRDRGPST